MDIHTAYQPPLTARARGVWTAVDADTYDGAPDAGSVMGHGLTEQEAIDDLLEQMAMRVGEAA